MTENNITPPPELVQQWFAAWESSYDEEMSFAEFAISRAAQYGADQELEASCEWFQEFYKLETWMQRDLKKLRVARRPKPPSLKEQALAELQISDERGYLKEGAVDTIRRALEQLSE
jgi:hypothetical protein